MSESTAKIDPRDQSEFAKEPERILENLAEYMDQCYAEFSTSKYREDAISEAKRGRKAYRQAYEKVSDPWPDSCGLTGPITAIAVDSLEPKLYQALCGQDEVVRAESGDEEDPQLKQVLDFDNYWLNNEVLIKRKTSDMIHDLVMDGTAYALGEWVLEEILQRDFVRLEDGSIAIDPKTGQMQTEDAITPAYEGGKLSHLTLEQVFVPDDVDDDDWDSCPLLRPVYYTDSEIKRNIKRGKLGWIKPKEDAQQNKDQGEIKEDKSTAQEVAGVEPSRLDLGKKHLEFHGEFDINGDGTPERIIALKAHDKQDVIRLLLQLDLSFDNRKVIRRQTIFRENRTSLGRGIPSIVSGLQKLFDKTLRHIFNASELQMLPFILANIQRVGFKDQRQRIRPGEVVDCQEPREAVFSSFPGDATRFMVLIEVVLSFLERMISSPDMSSASKDVMGVRNSMSTATGTMALLSEGNLKHDYKGKRLQEQYLEIIQLLHNLYYQNMPATTPKKVEQRLGFAVHKHQLALSPKFALVAASSTSNKYMDRKETLELLESLGKTGLAAATNPLKFLSDLLESYGKRNQESYIKPGLSEVVGALAKDEGLLKAVTQFIQQKVMEMKQMQAMQDQAAKAGLQMPQQQQAAGIPPGGPAPRQQIGGPAIG